MKAIVCRRYGSPDVLELEDLEMPSPTDDQVLVRVRAASANPLDWRMMRGEPFLVRMTAGLRKPKNPRIGVDVAGPVEAVGKNVTEFKPGDAVFGASDGSFGEYICVAAKDLVAKPDGISFEHAASVPVAALTALQALRNRAKLQQGQKVLINGAAGGVGTFAVQIAKSFGAEVTGVCSTGNVEMVRSIGADRVIDYTAEDFTKSGRYDVIVDCIASQPLSACKRALTPNGLYLAVGAKDGPLKYMFKVMLRSVTSRNFAVHLARRDKEDLATMAGLVASGKVTPVIDRTYPLAQTAEALRYLEAGHARGKVIITI